MTRWRSPSLWNFLRNHPDVVSRLRSDAQETARSFSWENVVVDTLLGKLEYVSLRQLVTPPERSVPSAINEASAVESGDVDAKGEVDATGDGDIPDDPTAESMAYGGGAAGRRLSIRPQAALDPRDDKTRKPSS